MKKISIKGLQRKTWKLVSVYIRKTANNGKCEMCRNKATQVDHCFSRRVKELFFNLSNLTALCGSCHTKKTYLMNAYDLKVYAFVEAREGKDVYDQMFWIAKAHKPFPKWSNREWLENKLEWAEGLSG